MQQWTTSDSGAFVVCFRKTLLNARYNRLNLVIRRWQKLLPGSSTAAVGAGVALVVFITAFIVYAKASKPAIPEPAVAAQASSVPSLSDSAQDGTPDFLRLDSARDRATFRRAFTFLAEAQYFNDPANRPPEIMDCAALIRYAYREALKKHDSAWADTARLPLIPALDSVGKFQYPRTPLGPALFRSQPGAFRPDDLTNGVFLQFADAKTLWKYNARTFSRDLSRAEPGDLLFFRQDTNHRSFHSMIYLGESRVQPDGQRYVLYHTGPTGSAPGELKRLTVEELLRFPQPEWRPVRSNPVFLGVARWNILRGGSDD